MVAIASWAVDPDLLSAQAALEALARDLAKTDPGAAGSLREGLADTLTIRHLGVALDLARTTMRPQPDQHRAATEARRTSGSFPNGPLTIAGLGPSPARRGVDCNP